jgi:hypothetical protein
MDEQEEFEFRARAERESAQHPTAGAAKPTEGILSRVGREAVGGVEAVASTASGIPASLGGGLTYLATLAASRDPAAAKAVQEQTQEALTYHPSSEYGKKDVQAIGNITNALVERPTEAAGDLTRRGATALGASPEVAGAAGATVKTGLQGIPYALGFRKGGQSIRAAESSAQAAEAAAEGTARDYVARSTGLDWNSVPDAIKGTLRAMAARGEDLSKLDPKALERVARAQSHDVPVPLTRAQSTRNLADITEEENLRRAPSGERLRERQTTQDTALHQNLARVREDVAPGSKVKSSADAGPSIQSAARRKLQVLKGQSTRLYEEARKTGDMQAPVSSDPLIEWLKEPANKANAAWIRARLKAYDSHPRTKAALPGEPEVAPIVSINNLERLRQEANAKVSEGGTKGHYAAQAKRVIDQMLDGAGGEAYQKARASWKAWNEEFGRQKSVRDLTSEKAGVTDRKIALEGTTDYVLKSSRESLEQIKDTLTKGGTEKTRARGEKAWRDLQAGVVQKLREEAAGKRGIRNEADAEQFNSTFLDRFAELDRSGKLEVLFGDKAAGKLRKIAETVRDVRTTPADRISGPNTASRLIAMMETLSHKVPFAGPAAAAGVKAATKGMRARAALRTPVDEAAAASAKAAKPKIARRSLKDIYRRGGGAAVDRREDTQ